MDQTAWATFWALIALIIFLGIVLYAGGHKTVAKSLDDRARRIRDELDEARRLREEAQALLAEYERKRQDAQKEASAIIERAKADAQLFAEDARRKMTETVERRTKMAEEKIGQAEAQAVKEVRSAATDRAIAAASQIIGDQMKGKAGDRLVEDAVAGIKSRLN
ncbi:MAG: ATP F0F1 synthase subunit B [Hyphomicrobiales bacterium]